MPVADAICKDGFVRWYERQLYESFACLVTGFLALIMMAIAIEVVEFHGSVADVLMLLVIAATGGTLCVGAWGRFHRLLSRAEHFAGQARCPACSAYGKFAVIFARTTPDALDGCSLGVCCKKCEHRWTIA